jgi:hypothetical protein
LFEAKQLVPNSTSDSASADNAETAPKNARSDSVLAQLLRDEDFIVRLIREDILISTILKKEDRYEPENSLLNKLELNLIIYDLLLLESILNKEETIDLYNKLIEDHTKMLSDFPNLSVYDMAVNCFLELKKVRKW